MVPVVPAWRGGLGEIGHRPDSPITRQTNFSPRPGLNGNEAVSRRRLDRISFSRRPHRMVPTPKRNVSKSSNVSSMPCKRCRWTKYISEFRQAARCKWNLGLRFCNNDRYRDHCHHSNIEWIRFCLLLGWNVVRGAIFALGPSTRIPSLEHCVQTP